MSTIWSGWRASSRRREGSSRAGRPRPRRARSGRDRPLRLDRAALDEALALLAEAGIEADALRIRAFPLAPEIAEFVRGHEHVFVVEQNRDAQMRTLMASDLSLDPAKLVSILHYGGAPITARFIADAVASRLRPASAALVLEDAT